MNRPPGFSTRRASASAFSIGFGVAADPFDAGDDAVIDRPGATDIEHLLVDVADDRVAAALGVEAAHRPAGDVAGAAGNIEQDLSGTRRKPGDELVLPPAMDKPAHQVIHQVVAARDAVEHRAHQRRLLVLPHPAKTEIGPAAGIGPKAGLRVLACLFLAHRAGR